MNGKYKVSKRSLVKMKGVMQKENAKPKRLAR